MITRLALFAVLLGCAAQPTLPTLAARQEPADAKGATQQGPYVAAVTLFVSANQEMNPSELCSILSSQQFLDSVHGKLGMGNSESVNEDPSRSYLATGAVSGEVVSLSVYSARRDAAKAALTAVLEAIPKLEPATVANAKRELADAQANYERRTAELKEARETKEKWVAANGPVDPANYFERARDQLIQYTQELAQVQFDVATQLSLRDFIKERLAAEPAEVETRRTIRNARRVLLERQLESLAEAQPGANADAAKFLEAQMKSIEALEKQLAAGGMADKEVIEKAPNPRRGDLENQLFDAERSLADLKSRDAALRKSCDALRAETTRLWKQQVEWESMQEALDHARDARSQASALLDQAQESAKQAAANPWYRVIAGPRFD